jgi:hypothetical protein
MVPQGIFKILVFGIEPKIAIIEYHGDSTAGRMDLLRQRKKEGPRFKGIFLVPVAKDSLTFQDKMELIDPFVFMTMALEVFTHTQTNIAQIHENIMKVNIVHVNANNFNGGLEKGVLPFHQHKKKACRFPGFAFSS